MNSNGRDCFCIINGVPYVHDLLVMSVLLGFSCVYRGLSAHV